MEEDNITLGRIIFYFYCTISIILGLIILIMNLTFVFTTQNDPDPNPGVALYGMIFLPMIIGLIISIIVSVEQHFKGLKTFKLSLINSILWFLGMIVLFI